MRLLHLADIHLGVETYGRLDPKTGLNSRLLDFARCFDEAVDRAIEDGVDLVVFAGDAYRSRDPNQTCQREFARRVRRLAKNGIPVFLLVGNHDLPSAVGKANSIDIFDTLEVDNVTVGRTRNVHTIDTKSGPIQIVALPWLQKSVLLAKEQLKSASADEINTVISNSVAEFVDEALKRLDPTVTTILVAHASILGATFGSERSVTLGQDYLIPWSSLARDEFSYVALGHLHKHQVLHQKPLTVYSGSIERVDFGEEREEKGFVMVDIGEGLVSHSFVPVSARRFLTIEVAVNGDDPTTAVLAAIAKQDVKDAVVKVSVKVDEHVDGRLDLGRVRDALKGSSTVASITRHTDTSRRMSWSGRFADDLTPLDALSAYLENKGVPEGRQKVLKEAASELMGDAP